MDTFAVIIIAIVWLLALGHAAFTFNKALKSKKFFNSVFFSGVLLLQLAMGAGFFVIKIGLEIAAVKNPIFGAVIISLVFNICVLIVAWTISRKRA